MFADGTAAMDGKNWDLAIKLFGDVLKATPITHQNIYDAHNRRSWCYERAEKLAEAIAVCGVVFCGAFKRSHASV
jgi:hypothetical protein